MNTPLSLDASVLQIIERDFQGLFSGELGLSSIKGGQSAADEALATLDITGYAGTRSQVLPKSHRGASGLSPYIRHNLLTLDQVYRAVKTAAFKDREKFRDELYWQEYARHLYARVGTRLFENLRYEVNATAPGDGWNRDMRCVDAVVSELETDGFQENSVTSLSVVNGRAGLSVTLPKFICKSKGWVKKVRKVIQKGTLGMCQQFL